MCFLLCDPLFGLQRRGGREVCATKKRTEQRNVSTITMVRPLNFYVPGATKGGTLGARKGRLLGSTLDLNCGSRFPIQSTKNVFPNR